MENMQSSWIDCFRGGWSASGNLRRVVLGMAMQMMQQWTGVNFICKSAILGLVLIANRLVYYGTTFFQTVGMKNAFAISMM